MINMRKKAILLSLIGFVLGMVVGVCIQLLIEPEMLSFADEKQARLIILYLIICGLLGTLCMGSTVLYDIERWSILRSTVTHFLICLGGLIVFFVLLIIIGLGILPDLGICVIILLACIFVYFCIWLTQYFFYRYRVKKMNEKLREWKARRSK